MIRILQPRNTVVSFFFTKRRSAPTLSHGIAVLPGSLDALLLHSLNSSRSSNGRKTAEEEGRLSLGLSSLKEKRRISGVYNKTSATDDAISS